MSQGSNDEAVTEPMTASQRRAKRAAQAGKSKAGRDLPAAIGVGAGLMLAVAAGVFLWHPLFVAFCAIACALGVWEVSRAVRTGTGLPLPLIPLVFGAVAMPVAAFMAGGQALTGAFVGSVVLAVLWNVLDGRGDAGRSIAASLFVLCWVPLLASFSVLLLREENGTWLLMTVLLLVVSNDTFGYIFGAWLGKHPLAPKISPKKSWEGFAGSVFGACVVGVILALTVLDAPWWGGAIMAAAVVIASTAGDLGESMIKRELGIKDMSNLLPGHGGIMDRLDSMVFAVPVGYLVAVAALGLGS
ncbi:MAG: phosphatidate cytidylyltransferase [Galactobacter sp.]